MPFLVFLVLAWFVLTLIVRRSNA